MIRLADDSLPPGDTTANLRGGAGNDSMAGEVVAEEPLEFELMPDAEEPPEIFEAEAA